MDHAEKPAHRARCGGDIRGSVISRGTATLDSGAVERYAYGTSARDAGRSGASGAHAASAEFDSLEWLEDGKHALDWNVPTGRIFSRFRQEDLDRPIIDQFERVVRQHGNRIAI